MLETNFITFLIDLSTEAEDNRYSFASIPLHQFKWWVYLYVLAFHTILVVIVTELMTRTYGKWYVWLILSFCLPVIGPISIILYHWIVSGSLTKSRKHSFWTRMLSGGPVNLVRIFHRQQAMSEELFIRNIPRGQPRPTNSEKSNKTIEALLQQGKYNEARGHAWKMIEIARDAYDIDQIDRYQEYLEIIAEKQSLELNGDLSS